MTHLVRSCFDTYSNFPQYFSIPLTIHPSARPSIHLNCLLGNLYQNAGTDEIHSRFLMEFPEHLAYPITLIFNYSVAEGRLSSLWKSANVTCIFKSGDKQSAKSANNSHLISRTSLLCKLLEKVIRDGLMSHCKDSSIFSDEQNGFQD